MKLPYDRDADAVFITLRDFEAAPQGRAPFDMAIRPNGTSRAVCALQPEHVPLVLG